MVNTPIVNFTLMKTIFAPKLVDDRKLFEPHILIKAIDYLTENATDGCKYTKMATCERSTRLCRQFD
jgi:hypothetical protein